MENFPLGCASSCGSTPRLLSYRSETQSPLREKWKVRTGPGREGGYRAKQDSACAQLAFKTVHELWVCLFSLSPGFGYHLRSE